MVEDVYIMKKRIFSFLIALSIFFYIDGTVSAMTTENMKNNIFTDVSEDAYYYNAVTWSSQKGIALGVNTDIFDPDRVCSIADTLTFLWRANGAPEPTIKNPFKDIIQDDYYYKAALWAFEKELISGNIFTASNICTRGQVMLLFYLLAGSPQTELVKFDDIAMDSVYLRAVSWAVNQKIAYGKTQRTFAPDEICTRGDVIVFVYKAQHN